VQDWRSVTHFRSRQFDKRNESSAIRVVLATSSAGTLCAVGIARIRTMPGKIRALDHRPIRLSEPVRQTIERLARLANVTPSEIVDFILTEVLEEAGLPDPLPDASPAPSTTRGCRTGTEPAAVIPITSARRVRPH
jgi:hypothetical protein